MIRMSILSTLASRCATVYLIFLNTRFIEHMTAERVAMHRISDGMYRSSFLFFGLYIQIVC
jgi:hypothetical protein